MVFAVRCFSCGKILACYHEKYKRRLNRGEKAGMILTSMKIQRLCCRRMFLAHVETDHRHMVQHILLTPHVSSPTSLVATTTTIEPINTGPNSS